MDRCDWDEMNDFHTFYISSFKYAHVRVISINGIVIACYVHFVVEAIKSSSHIHHRLSSYDAVVPRLPTMQQWHHLPLSASELNKCDLSSTEIIKSLENNTWFSSVLPCMYWRIIHGLYHIVILVYGRHPRQNR